MAKQKGNVVTYGLSGKVGDLLVFRQRNGKTVVSKIPTMPKTVSEKQMDSRIRFQRATIYAKAAIVDPETGELYAAGAKKQKGKTAYNIAIADFFNAPNIDTVDLSDYNGAADETIRIVATDDFAVKSVHVSIINADGVTVEEGEAVHGAGNMWKYTTTQENGDVSGYKIEVDAYDLPGNIAHEEKSID
jgi:hypothetical protein